MLLLCSGDDRDGLITRLRKGRGCDWEMGTHFRPPNWASVFDDLRSWGASSVRLQQASKKLVVQVAENFHLGRSCHRDKETIPLGPFDVNLNNLRVQRHTSSSSRGSFRIVVQLLRQSRCIHGAYSNPLRIQPLIVSELAKRNYVFEASDTSRDIQIDRPF